MTLREATDLARALEFTVQRLSKADPRALCLAHNLAALREGLEGLFQVSPAEKAMLAGRMEEAA